MDAPAPDPLKMTRKATGRLDMQVEHRFENVAGIHLIGVLRSHNREMVGLDPGEVGSGEVLSTGQRDRDEHLPSDGIQRCCSGTGSSAARADRVDRQRAYRYPGSG